MRSRQFGEFSNILAQARGLGEFEATRLFNLIEAVGNAAGNDAAYNALIEEVAELVSERTGEAEGALVLLKRAQQLDFGNHFEMIRLLGKAARQLTKKEHAEKLIEALQLLTRAYRSAGLLWASRATCIFAAASIAIEGEADSQIDVAIVPTIEFMAWIALQLRHLPDFLEAIQLLNGCLKALPLAEESMKLLKDRLVTLDMALGSYFLNFQADELRQVAGIPDILRIRSGSSPHVSHCFTPLVMRTCFAVTGHCRLESPVRLCKRWSRGSLASRSPTTSGVR